MTATTPDGKKVVLVLSSGKNGADAWWYYSGIDPNGQFENLTPTGVSGLTRDEAIANAEDRWQGLILGFHPVQSGADSRG